MKRRQLIHYAGAGLLATTGIIATSSTSGARTQRSTLNIQWLGHTCFLFSGGGVRVLVNPFRTIGCTAGYRLPRVAADLVLVSSLLFDEGAAEDLPGNPRSIFEPGVYDINNIRFQGINMPHDRRRGRQFGMNVAWGWSQGGIKILHLGGAAAPIEIEQQILMGRPDVALIPVGGSEKAYNPQEAYQAMQTLKPKIVIPTHYRTQAADPVACNLDPVDDFLQLAATYPTNRVGGDTLSLSPGNLPENSAIRVLSYKF